MTGPIRPGLCSIAFRGLSWEAVVDLAAGAGLEGIEWGADLHVPAGELDRARAVGDATRRRGLVVASYGSYLRAGDVEATGSGAAAVTAVLDTAVALGAPNVRVWCRWLAATDAGAADRSAVAADLRRWCAAADERDLTISLEHHQWTLTESVPATHELLDAVSAPNLFSYWQPCDGLDPSAAVAEVRALGGRLSHLHVFRWDGFEDRHPLAAGEDLWPDVLDQAAPGAAPAGPEGWSGERWALLEYVRGDDPDQLVEDAAVLRRWLDGQGRGPGG